MRLIAALVRHGKYEQPAGVPSGHLPHPLTTDGEAEARSLSDLLTHASSEHGAVVHRTLDSSRMLRAWQTAKIAAKELTTVMREEFTVEEFDALAERGLGAAANLTMEAIEIAVRRDPRCNPLSPGWKADSAFRLPFQGAESLLEAGQRAARHIAERLDDLGRSVDRDTVKVFVGHGGAFRHAAVVLGALEQEEVPRLSMWHCRPVLLERGTGGTFTHLSGTWKQRSSAPEAAD